MPEPVSRPASDRALVCAIGRGDAAALEQVYDAHKDALLNVAVHMLGERAAAEDVLQDVFVQLARRASSVRLEVGLRSYLLTAALNRARDRLRRPCSPVVVGAEVVDDAVGPAAAAGATERATAVASALSTLPVEQREVVILHVFEGAKFREIGELLGASINTVQSRYRYALASLRARLTKQGVRG